MARPIFKNVLINRGNESLQPAFIFPALSQGGEQYLFYRAEIPSSLGIILGLNF